MWQLLISWLANYITIVSFAKQYHLPVFSVSVITHIKLDDVHIIFQYLKERNSKKTLMFTNKIKACDLHKHNWNLLFFFYYEMHKDSTIDMNN